MVTIGAALISLIVGRVDGVVVRIGAVRDVVELVILVSVRSVAAPLLIWHLTILIIVIAARSIAITRIVRMVHVLMSSEVWIEID